LKHRIRLNNIKPIVLTSTNGWRIGKAEFVKSLCGGEVSGSNPTASIRFYQKNIEPMSGCHVAAHDKTKDDEARDKVKANLAASDKVEAKENIVFKKEEKGEAK
jgi:hypothetical protein